MPDHQETYTNQSFGTNVVIEYPATLISDKDKK